jgi:hypothetical protein
MNTISVVHRVSQPFRLHQGAAVLADGRCCLRCARPVRLRRPPPTLRPPTATAAAVAAAAFPEGWPLWACLAACTASSELLERRTPVGQFLSAPLAATLLTLSLSAIGILPSVSPTYDVIWNLVMPLAAGLYLLGECLHPCSCSSLCKPTKPSKASNSFFSFFWYCFWKVGDRP